MEVNTALVRDDVRSRSKLVVNIVKWSRCTISLAPHWLAFSPGQFFSLNVTSIWWKKWTDGWMNTHIHLFVALHILCEKFQPEDKAIHLPIYVHYWGESEQSATIVVTICFVCSHPTPSPLAYTIPDVIYWPPYESCILVIYSWQN